MKYNKIKSKILFKSEKHVSEQGLGNRAAASTKWVFNQNSIPAPRQTVNRML